MGQMGQILQDLVVLPMSAFFFLTCWNLFCRDLLILFCLMDIWIPAFGLWLPMCNLVEAENLNVEPDCFACRRLEV